MKKKKRPLEMRGQTTQYYNISNVIYLLQITLFVYCSVQCVVCALDFVQDVVAADGIYGDKTYDCECECHVFAYLLHIYLIWFKALSTSSGGKSHFSNIVVAACLIASWSLLRASSI